MQSKNKYKKYEKYETLELVVAIRKYQSRLYEKIN